VTTRRRGAGIGPRGLVAAALLGLAALPVGWLAVRAAAVRALPAASPNLAAIAPGDPSIVLARAADALLRQHGILSPATLAAVRRAATDAPLDARPYLILGHQRLLEGDAPRARATLEAGRRLDPRQRLIHLLLLDRYLRESRFAQAGSEFSVLARLMGPTQAPIATALAAMTLNPGTRDAVRRTLATDPDLERAVLVALARSDTPPADIFALASPAARVDAAGWAPALVERLVERGRFNEARGVWQRIHRLSPAAAAAPIFNPGFARVPASPPFNWTLVAGSMGAADIRDGGLAVDYYGRESGDLASQLLVLRPGRYRFSVVVDPGKTDPGAGVRWSLVCATGDHPTLATLPVAAGPARRKPGVDFAVPASCPAQALVLRGEAGEFPVPVAVVLRAPDITPLTGARP